MRSFITHLAIHQEISHDRDIELTSIRSQVIGRFPDLIPSFQHSTWAIQSRKRNPFPAPKSAFHPKKTSTRAATSHADTGTCPLSVAPLVGELLGELVVVGVVPPVGDPLDEGPSGIVLFSLKVSGLMQFNITSAELLIICCVESAVDLTGE